MYCAPPPKKIWGHGLPMRIGCSFFMVRLKIIGTGVDYIIIILNCFDRYFIAFGYCSFKYLIIRKYLNLKHTQSIGVIVKSRYSPK